jgi:hypothetical protein
MRATLFDLDRFDPSGQTNNRNTALCELSAPRPLTAVCASGAWQTWEPGRH